MIIEFLSSFMRLIYSRKISEPMSDLLIFTAVEFGYVYWILDDLVGLHTSPYYKSTDFLRLSLKLWISAGVKDNYF